MPERTDEHLGLDGSGSGHPGDEQPFCRRVQFVGDIARLVFFQDLTKLLELLCCCTCWRSRAPSSTAVALERVVARNKSFVLNVNDQRPGEAVLLRLSESLKKLRRGCDAALRRHGRVEVAGAM